MTLWSSEGYTLLFFSLESGLLAAANRNHQQHPVTTSAVATPAIVPSTAGTTLKSWKTNLLMKAIQRPSITRHRKNRSLLTDFLEPIKKGRTNIYTKLNVLIFHKNALPFLYVNNNVIGYLPTVCIFISQSRPVKPGISVS